MKIYLLIILLIVGSICKANINVKLYYEKTENGFSIYADNNEYCPISIKVDFETSNMNIEGGNNKIYVLETLVKKQLIKKLTPTLKNKPYNFSYKFVVNYGNVNLVNYDDKFEYNLPFNKLSQYKVSQGYNGKISHFNENSIDFMMPIGTEFNAVREGIVVAVVDNNNINCAKEECQKYNNYILIYHSDGTFASYVHLKQNGSKVKIGDKIKENQLLGYSGNVGWSKGPHLHITIFKLKMNERETLKTLFKIDDGKTSVYLQEKEFYFKNY